MKKIVTIILCLSMLFSVSTSFAQGNAKEYQSKIDLVSGKISEDEYEKSVMKNRSEKLATIDFSAKQNSELESVSLDNYRIVDSKVFTIDDVEFEEIYYKPIKKETVIGKMFSIFRASGPENGDFKIVISREKLSGKDWFDTIEGYGNYLLNETKFSLLKYGTYLDSNNLRALIAYEFIEYIEDGLKGEGTAYSLDRDVYKWGQIYKNGDWVDYYYGKQYEVKWGFKFIVYDSSNRVIDDEEYTYYYENDDPIFIKAGKYFRDNDEVFNISNELYRTNGYIYRDTYLSVTKKASDWERGIDPCYK